VFFSNPAVTRHWRWPKKCRLLFDLVEATFGKLHFEVARMTSKVQCTVVRHSAAEILEKRMGRVSAFCLA